MASIKIEEIFKEKEKTFSFEFFPPKNFKATIEFGINVGQLLKLSPDFVSVTYGAGGSNQKATFDLVDYLQNQIGLTTMAHYTCINATKDKIKSDLAYLDEVGIKNLMLLRGDPPKGEDTFVKSEGGFNYASELISYANSLGEYSIGVAGYPEKHPEAVSLDADIDNLKRKVDAGGDFIVTQMFYDNQRYYDFVDRCREKGIKARIIPGIMPITNFSQIKRFSEMVGTEIPQEIVNAFAPYKDNKKKMYELGIYLGLKQCIELLENGAPGLHFYTLNKSRATVDIFESIPKILK
ncbi:methylenetetrahydrofolate reductase [NAD(P)H] [Aureibacter tunicatorum]|uniref:Methylenetetrahydrofolate reductase n=1 Tax=Aureibacter tunicatorum TaxID=866807 RepID=A0AAE3XJ28_9BACT|nr:methylenetetrahydrofolate reductase [NAD(P)H] [Aureibacter tunicatorum]MDR6237335.1 methylenetetrahydrofolate reductase (NADPH) [Aureibacter tunicatorum]BDD06326.1 5,10-methylenetetrahydrofolate reductase [Aureibacter tunicatorum]